MTRIGLDTKFVDGVTWWGGPLDTLRAVAALGFEGVHVRTIDEIAPALDPAALDDFAALATELGLYVQMGVGKSNPYMTAELPRVRELGDGDYMLGMRRMIEASAVRGWTQLWTALGGFKRLPGLFFTDRFRTDTDWADQLAASTEFLRRLAPVLRETGTRLNIETHEEVTTFEIVRIIEEVGPDVLGVCLDPGNLLVRGEVPLDAIERVAPYVHTTHLRDAALIREDGALVRFLAPCGEGVIDWDAALDLLLTANPALDLSIEPIGAVRAEMRAHVADPVWLAGHPDLTDSALAELDRLAAAHEARIAAGGADDVDELRRRRSDAEIEAFAMRCAVYLRAALARREQEVVR